MAGTTGGRSAAGVASAVSPRGVHGPLRYPTARRLRRPARRGGLRGLGRRHGPMVLAVCRGILRDPPTPRTPSRRLPRPGPEGGGSAWAGASSAAGWHEGGVPDRRPGRRRRRPAPGDRAPGGRGGGGGRGIHKRRRSRTICGQRCTRRSLDCRRSSGCRWCSATSKG